MANPATPFTATTVTLIAVPRNQKLILRLENLVTVFTVVKVNGTAAAIDADYFLTGGDAVEIVCHEDQVISVLNITGTPKTYYRIEPLSTFAT